MKNFGTTKNRKRKCWHTPLIINSEERIKDYGSRLALCFKNPEIGEWKAFNREGLSEEKKYLKLMKLEHEYECLDGGLAARKAINNVLYDQV